MSYFFTLLYVISTEGALRNVVRKKTGLCGKKVADPLPPVWEFSHFFYRFFAILYAPELENREKNMEWVWVRPLSPLWEFFPHNPVFFLTTFLSQLLL